MCRRRLRAQTYNKGTVQVPDTTAPDGDLTQTLMRRHPMLDLRLTSDNVGLILFTGGVGSGKRSAADMALRFYEEQGGEYLDLENVAASLTSDQWMAVGRSSSPVIYFGDICEGELWLHALDLVDRGFGVIACVHAINNEELADQLEQIGMPPSTAVDRIKMMLMTASRYKNREPEDARSDIAEWVNYLTTQSPFLEVRLGQSSEDITTSRSTEKPH